MHTHVFLMRNIPVLYLVDITYRLGTNGRGCSFRAHIHASTYTLIDMTAPSGSSEFVRMSG